MRVKYCCEDDARAFENYYVNQCGNGLPVFYGSRTQRGHGIGSIFSSLFRTVFPLLKRVGPALGRKALQTGMQIASDVASGQSFKESAKTHVMDAIQEGKTHVMDAIQEGINKIAPVEKMQSGSGIRRKRNRKRRKIDIFS